MGEQNQGISPKREEEEKKKKKKEGRKKVEWSWVRRRNI